MSSRDQLTEIVTRKIPSTGDVGIEFQGLNITLPLAPGHAVALVDRVLYHLMERGVDEQDIQQSLQHFAMTAIEPLSIGGMPFLVYEMRNGLRFASNFKREELKGLRDRIDALLAQPSGSATH